MILCRKVLIPDTGTAWITVRPADTEAVGEFVRSRKYFDASLWSLGRFDGEAGGDAVLSRIAYRWPDRHLAAAGLSWGEADAFCRSLSGRLPWFREWQALEKELSCLDIAAFKPHGVNTTMASWLAGHRPAAQGEWCADWYNPNGMGPGVYPEAPLRRRTTRPPWCMAPKPSADRGLGFRICFDQPGSVWSTGLDGWELVTPAVGSME